MVEHLANGNFIVRLPSGRVIEYEKTPDGGGKPVTVIEPDGMVYFESDMIEARELVKSQNRKTQTL